MAVKATLTIAEQIDRVKDGRSQTSIVEKMVAAGLEINEVKFSRKKLGREEFTPEELKALSEILGTEITMS